MIVTDMNSFLFCSPEPAEDLPECSSEAGGAAAFQHPQWRHGRQQSDEAAADREGATAAEAAGAAAAETTGQESGVEAFWKKTKQNKKTEPSVAFWEALRP